MGTNALTVRTVKEKWTLGITANRVETIVKEGNVWRKRNPQCIICLMFTDAGEIDSIWGMSITIVIAFFEFHGNGLVLCP